MDRYPQGYLPKIKYWAEQLVSAADHGDVQRIPRIMEKLKHFTTKQEELEGSRL